MNSRRKFLLHGSLAATAFIAAKPLESVANVLTPMTGFHLNNNKVILMHTGDLLGTDHQSTLKHIANQRSRIGNLLVLHAGKPGRHGTGTIKGFDASIPSPDHILKSVADYKIIYKGNIKIGIISASSGEQDPVKRVNNISTWLKNEKNCHLVVCLSQLGYQSKDNIDDISLAQNSVNLDIIIGGDEKNFCKRPVIMTNKLKQEVIINHAANHELALRKIEIEFDGGGKKKNIAVSRSVPFMML